MGVFNPSSFGLFLIQSKTMHQILEKNMPKSHPKELRYFFVFVVPNINPIKGWGLKTIGGRIERTFPTSNSNLQLGYFSWAFTIMLTLILVGFIPTTAFNFHFIC